MITRLIDRNFANMRLDRFLRKAFPDESLSVFFAVLRKKKIRVNGVIGKANQMLAEGDVINIYENFKSVPINEEKQETKNENEKNVQDFSWSSSKSGWGKSKTSTEKNAAWGVSRKLDIVIQTEDYVVVNKPSGLASQPGSGTRPGESLVEYLWEWGREEGLDFRPTIAHRLDQETSGLLIAALHGDTLRDLTRLIREHEVDKFYFALVKGNLKRDKGTIDETLTRTDAAKGSKMKVGENGKDAQRAITHYHVKQHYEGYDLVKIKLETGRMHQIRAHFASIGHPLLGDTRYGDFALNREVKKELGLHRLFLHSCRLEFTWKGDKIVLDSPLPKELQDVVNQLKPIKAKE
ncbi:MAG: RluA family pseudouridine synthase [Fibrobacter sp.]|nr:RluA family pseudouridine synthase [Fibrobacter sp.]